MSDTGQQPGTDQPANGGCSPVPCSAKLERFACAFSTHSGGCRNQCECGRVFYNPDSSWSWDEGELEALELDPNAIPVDYAVSTIGFEGKICVWDCDCWHARAEKIMGWIDSHANKIAAYLNGEAEHKKQIADKAPRVGPNLSISRNAVADPARAGLILRGP